ncbi:MAG TPA: ATP-binding protein [Pararobbsia sp.]|nr:ATP-binding protein [Pararobbsia sp.]
MLIEFSVANFRSFRERQTLQMSAAPRLSKKENTFTANVPGEKLPNLLKAVAVYGANASGKSSLVMAMDVIPTLLSRRPQAAAHPLPVEPFRFDSALIGKPSEFEVHFIASATRYQFKLCVTRERIVHESLTVYPRGKATPLYERNYVKGVDDYAFGGAIEGNEVMLEAWRKLTGPQTLFLSQAVANSGEEMLQLRTPYTWLQEGVIIVRDDLSRWARIGRLLPADQRFAPEISTFLRDVDVPVTGIRPDRTEQELARIAPRNGKDKAEPRRRLDANNEPTLVHKTRLGEAEFDLSEESRGTRNLLAVWAPLKLLSLNADIDDRHRVLVIDEFDSSLHPELVRDLVQKHLVSSINTQLIFTTHDTHLMSTRLLRRDQFWLTDRDSNGATKLDSIHSFEGREGEDIERRYFEGRYRGLPIRRRK